MSDDQAVENTDREIWRKVPDDYYSPSIHVTEMDGIGMNLGGTVIVLPIEIWFQLAKEYVNTRFKPVEYKEDSGASCQICNKHIAHDIHNVSVYSYAHAYIPPVGSEVEPRTGDKL